MPDTVIDYLTVSDVGPSVSVEVAHRCYSKQRKKKVLTFSFLLSFVCKGFTNLETLHHKKELPLRAECCGEISRTLEGT